MDKGCNFIAASSEHNLLLVNHHQQQHTTEAQSLHRRPPAYMVEDPHLVSLQLGKRDYFVDNGEHLSSSLSAAGKKGKATTGMMVRCQVEKCKAEMKDDVKKYHKRHKVCEVHAKATTVVVRGVHQRFCQQCSRFHSVNEFDEAKRSCRRRLAGHNERRRKTPHVSLSRNASQERALSLLSSESDYYVSPANICSSSSAALNELIAESRTAHQLMLLGEMSHSHDYTNAIVSSYSHAQSLLGHAFTQHHLRLLVQSQQDRDQAQQEAQHVTLDLMHSKEAQEEEACNALWHSLNGAHIS